MPSSFLGIYRALYAYTPQAEGELEIQEGDLLYLLERSDEDSWWKCKKKSSSDDEDDEPIGLVANNYIEEAKPLRTFRAMYDYTRQTDEELSFEEGTILDAYDTSDDDWVLVGRGGEYGFAPSNYLEESDEPSSARAASHPTPSSPPAITTTTAPQHKSVSFSDQRDEYDDEPPTPGSVDSGPRPSPAAAVAAIIQKQAGAKNRTPSQDHTKSNKRFTPSPDFDDDDDDDDYAPRLPSRPAASSPEPSLIPPGYTVFEVQEVLSPRRKTAVSLGLGLKDGKIILVPSAHRSQTTQWDLADLETYNMEGKHVFLDLQNPERNLDLHAGSKDVAQDIMKVLGEMHGAARAEGLKEVLAASRGTPGGGRKMGEMLYDFDAQGADEVSVRAGDLVAVLDDEKSDEWWMVRRESDGKEGVVPSSYVEVKAQVSSIFPTLPTNTRLSDDEVGPGVKLPKRGSSLYKNGESKSRSNRRDGGRESEMPPAAPAKPKPDPGKVRTWTDRSGTFKVDAALLGCHDGKINLHKINGVKIAVPVSKMSEEDITYVERVTGTTLDEDRPLSTLKKGGAGAVIEPKSQEPKQDDYDWFDFFLSSGVDHHACQRYANNFSNGGIDESILSEITPATLRNLGINKEGDILRIMKLLDTKYSRKKKGVSFGGAEFMDGDGEQRNGQRGRPAPPTSGNDVVDPNILKVGTQAARAASTSTPPVEQKPPTRKNDLLDGFDDDAWTPKPARPQPQSHASPQPASSMSPSPRRQTPTGAAADLSLLSQPLQPVISHTTSSPPPTQAAGRARPVVPDGPLSPTLEAPPQGPPRPVSAPQGGPSLGPPPAALTAQLTGVPATTVSPPNQPSLQDLQQQIAQLKLQQQQNEIQRLQQQNVQLQSQVTGFQRASFAVPQPPPFINGQTPQFGGPVPGGLQQPQAQPGLGYPPLLQNQNTGYLGQFNMPQARPTGSINSLLPPPLIPQRTAMPVQQTPSPPQPQFGFQPPPMPPMPPQATQGGLMPGMRPLQSQKTGPPPPVRFGTGANKPAHLQPQPTGKRANLSAATPENPFGF